MTTATLEPRLASALRKPWKPRPKVSPSEWVEQNRFMQVGESIRPGKWSFEVTPYLRWIIDLFDTPGVEMVVMQKGTQLGGTEVGLSLLGYWADVEHGRCLVVCPNEKASKEYVTDRLRPMIESSPRLSDLKTEKSWDMKTGSVLLRNGHRISTGWPNSPMSMASKAIRYVIMEEGGKWPDYARGDADPVTLIEARTQTWGPRRRIFANSSPTYARVGISKLIARAGVVYDFWAPCVHCGEYQMMSFDRIRWPELPEIEDRVHKAEKIKDERLAWYECKHCDERMTNDDKRRFLKLGKFLHGGQSIRLSGAGGPIIDGAYR